MAEQEHGTCDTSGCSRTATHDDRGFVLSGQPFFSKHCRSHVGMPSSAKPPEPAAMCGSAEVVEAVREAKAWCADPDDLDGVPHVCALIEACDSLLQTRAVCCSTEVAECCEAWRGVAPDWAADAKRALVERTHVIAPRLLDLLRTATIRHESAVRADVEKPIRELLCELGHCGDGDLPKLVRRAIVTAKNHSEKFLADAIQRACHVVDGVAPRSSGTLAERTKAALAKARAEERERCAAVRQSAEELLAAIDQHVPSSATVPHETALRDAIRALGGEEQPVRDTDRSLDGGGV